MATKTTYDQTDELSDWEFARLRTEVNFGSREVAEETIVGFTGDRLEAKAIKFVPALATYFREVVDNAIDEVIGHGHGGEIKIRFDEPTMTFSVEDDGRGIPSDLVPKLLARARAGRNFRQRGNVAGTNGIGAAATNFTSEFFEVDARHNGTRHVQVFREDVKKGKFIEGQPTITKCDKGDHGTLIRFRPSAHVYPNMVLPEEFVKARVYEIAVANPKLRVYYNGGRIKVDPKVLFRGFEPIVIECDDETEVTHSVARELGASETTVTKHKFTSVFYLVPDFTDAKDDTVHSLVNSICAYNGGTHVATFRSMFYNGILDAIKPDAKRRKLEVARQDIAPGLLIYNITRMVAPNFDSQSKTKLTNPDAGRAVSRALDEKTFKRIASKNQEWMELILKRCAERTQSKDLAEAEKLSKKRLNKRVAKLDDATGSDRSKCILFIAEGDSAIKGMSNERDAKIHGGLPLTGKIMNVSGESPSKVVNSEALSNMMMAIGLAIGKKAIRSQLRYGKVCIATDEDEDGKNITALLVNFFYTYWPELFDPQMEPFIHKFETPYIILEKRGQKRVYYTARTYKDFRPEDYKEWDIIRAKGLGRMKPAHWRDALSDLSLIPIIDDGRLKASLDLVFNNDRADDRKEWLK